MDEQRRSRHDLSAAGTPAAGHAPADHPNRQGHHLLLFAVFRLRRWKHGIPRHPHRRTRAHQAEKALEATYYGYSIGKWEGDTLVIDSTSFVDTTWLGRGGLFHSANMHIIEKLTRVGNEIRYDMTIEDPDSFIEPWVMPTRILRLNAAADPVISERANCEVYETGKISTQLRH